MQLLVCSPREETACDSVLGAAGEMRLADKGPAAAAVQRPSARSTRLEEGRGGGEVGCGLDQRVHPHPPPLAPLWSQTAWN